MSDIRSNLIATQEEVKVIYLSINLSLTNERLSDIKSSLIVTQEEVRVMYLYITYLNIFRPIHPSNYKSTLIATQEEVKAMYLSTIKISFYQSIAYVFTINISLTEERLSDIRSNFIATHYI